MGYGSNAGQKRKTKKMNGFIVLHRGLVILFGVNFGIALEKALPGGSSWKVFAVLGTIALVAAVILEALEIESRKGI